MSGLNSSIGIYQPLFNEAIREYLDPGFITLDWLHNPSPELRELALHHYILQSRIFERHNLTGIVSPKFFSKTGLTSHEVKDWIHQNPGHEIYSFDGRPFVPYTSYNSLEQAARSHPGFEDRMRRVCRAIGFDLPVELGPLQFLVRQSGLLGALEQGSYLAHSRARSKRSESREQGILQNAISLSNPGFSDCVHLRANNELLYSIQRHRCRDVSLDRGTNTRSGLASPYERLPGEQHSVD